MSFVSRALSFLRPEVAFALMTRGTQALTMLAAAVCVAWRLNLEEQGLFFVFMSLGALLQLCDFGLAYAVLQTASHLRSDGDAARFARFRRRGHTINLIALAIAAPAVGVAGALIFSANGGANSGAADWAGPWVVFTIAVFAMQLANLELVIVEGGRSVVEAWRVRFVQESIGGFVFIGALVAGAGLWSLSCYWGMRALVVLPWLWRGRFHTPQHVSAGIRFDWRKEVWPFQWRMGLSMISGFFVYQAFNPIILVEQGAAVAGRFGMSLAMMNMLILVSTVWPLSQVVRFVDLIGRVRFEELRAAFLRLLAASTLLAMCAAGAVFGAIWWMTRMNIPFAERFADLGTTGWLLAAAVVHHVIICFAVLLRAERREPLLVASVAGGVLTVVAVWIAARHGVARDVAVANLLCNALGIPIVLAYYRGLMLRTRAPRPLTSEPAT